MISEQELSTRISNQIDTVWELANNLRHNVKQYVDCKGIFDQADELENLLNVYNSMNFTSLPSTTTWLAKEMVEAAREIASGYGRLQVAIS